MSIGAFNYQTSESTLLGSVDQLRIRSENNLYNYLPVLSGENTNTDLGVPVQAAYMSGLSGDASKLNAYLREINAMNRALLAAQKRDPDNSDEKITIKDITNAGRFVMFGRAPGKREVGVKITATVTFNRFDESTFPDTNEDFTKSVEVYLPVDLAQRAREEYDNSPTDADFNLVRQRGASLTDQEIALEVARAKKQAGMSAEANRRAAEEPATKITPGLREKMGRESSERRAKNAVKYVKFEEAAEKNKKSSGKYKWGVDLSVYNGGPGDVRLASDVAAFQKQSKLEADGIVGPKTLDAIKQIRLRMISEGTKAKVPVEILALVTSFKIDGLKDARTGGAVTQEKFEELKKQGVVKEQAKPSQVIAEHANKYPEAAKAAKLTLPDVVKSQPQPQPKPATSRPTPRSTTTGQTTQPTPAADTGALASATRANIVSAQTLGWKTNSAVYPEGPASLLLAQDLAFIQRKFGIGGASGVMSPELLDRIKSQQLAGLGAVQADSADTLQVASRLLSGVVMPTLGGYVDKSNWWYVGGGAVALAALAAAFYASKPSTPAPKQLA